MSSARTISGPELVPWRNLVCLTMVTLLPVSLWSQDTGAVMLHSTSGVQINKNTAPASSALFPDDLVETQKQTVARIEASGSTADIHPDTVIQFEGDELVLEHGSVSVNTSRLLRVRVGCVTVTPVNADWTQYDVTDMDGRITVSALKNDVYFESRNRKTQPSTQPAKESDQNNRTIVHETEQKSRSEKCGAADIKESDRYAGRGAIMNSPWARGAGIIGIGVLTCWALCRGDDPVSPSHP